MTADRCCRHRRASGGGRRGPSGTSARICRRTWSCGRPSRNGWFRLRCSRRRQASSTMVVIQSLGGGIPAQAHRPAVAESQSVPTRSSAWAAVRASCSGAARTAVRDKFETGQSADNGQDVVESVRWRCAGGPGGPPSCGQGEIEEASVLPSCSERLRKSLRTRWWNPADRSARRAPGTIARAAGHGERAAVPAEPFRTRCCRGRALPHRLQVRARFRSRRSPKSSSRHRPTSRSCTHIAVVLAVAGPARRVETPGSSTVTGQPSPDRPVIEAENDRNGPCISF